MAAYYMLVAVNQNGLQGGRAQINSDKHYYYSRAVTGFPVWLFLLCRFVMLQVNTHWGWRGKSGRHTFW
ncbi:hypothetical protein Geu3261_0256_004 [Komagataeibacter europaeus NBRC 3261]|uniref:Uncharacterized protein n=1 Tax=Komagataeibacter europaeus NBRC 3261 TaxID=1234669 RepID=A0A0D6Q3A9_KOMEU|nr:hypothetical protein Geu3261_0256_004 [Komagataeibacter europaeus NBRC 3261]